MELVYTKSDGWSRRLAPYLTNLPLAMFCMALVRLGNGTPTGTFGLLHMVSFVLIGVAVGLFLWLVVRLWDCLPNSPNRASGD